MNTMSNTKSRRGKANPPRVRLVSDPSPKAKSVDYSLKP